MHMNLAWEKMLLKIESFPFYFWSKNMQGLFDFYVIIANQNVYFLFSLRSLISDYTYMNNVKKIIPCILQKFLNLKYVDVYN